LKFIGDVRRWECEVFSAFQGREADKCFLRLRAKERSRDEHQSNPKMKKSGDDNIFVDDGDGWDESEESLEEEARDEDDSLADDEEDEDSEY